MTKLTAAIAHILDTAGQTAGAAFVVTEEGLIATCAHVVEAAGAGPGGTVSIAFHATGEMRQATVEPAWWRAPATEDVAILRLEGSLPEGVEPLSLGSSGGTYGHPFKTFGFPDASPEEGIWGDGHILEATKLQGVPVLQLRSQEVTPGFSGAPVLDTLTRRVVGMVTSITNPDEYGRLAETAFITPTETLRQICPELRLSDICPYRGLAAFTEADAEFFFGREALVADLVTHLRSNPRFLAVVGPSGSGKSSVVRAGLFPALRRGEVPGSEEWHLVAFRPGADPFAALAGVGLETQPRANLRAAVQAFLHHCPEVGRLTLFVDQFEELFALCPEAMQDEFMRELLALLESELPVTVILTLRADFYGYLLRYASLVEWLKLGQVNVPPMGPEELQAAIRKPAEEVGLRFEPGLVQLVTEETGQVEHALPLLESSLTQLWERREEGALTHDAYQGIGQVTGAIGLWAEDAYSRLSEEEKRLTRQVFTRLVHFGEGEVANTHQRCSLAELVTYPEQLEEVHLLVQHLADARLLVTDRDPRTGEQTIEIIHDALLREWGRLRRWLTEQREFYLWRQRLDERLQEWQEKAHDVGLLLRGATLTEAERWLIRRASDLNLDERNFIRASSIRGKKIRRAVISGVVIAFLMVSLLALLTWWQRNVAIEERKAAVAAQVTAIAEAEIRATAQAEAESQRQIAVARQLAAQSQTALDNTGAGLVRSVLLAIESLRHSVTFEGDQAIRRGLDLLPRSIVRVRHENAVLDMALSSDGKWLATGSMDGTARVWETATGREMIHVTQEPQVGIVALSPDGRWLVTGSGNTIIVWNVATGKELTRRVHDSLVEAIAFSPDGKWLATGSLDGTVQLWETVTSREVALAGHRDEVWALAFSPDSRWLATGSWDGTARVWQVASGEQVARMSHEAGLLTVAFSPDGKWLATGSLDGNARVWELVTGQEVSRMAHYGSVEAVIFSPDGNWLATGAGAYDNSARVWEAATGKEVARMEHEGLVQVVAFSPDSKWLATGSLDNTARVWAATSGEELARIVHDGLPQGTFRRVIRRSDFAVGSSFRDSPAGGVPAVAFSPDGKWLATASWDSSAQVWEAVTGQEVTRMGHEDAVMAVDFSPDGRWLLTRSGVYTAPVLTERLWDITSDKDVALLPYRYSGNNITFSPNGRWLATEFGARIVQVWDTITGRKMYELGHENAVTSIAFSPDSQRLATGSRDNTLQVWETATGREVTRMATEGEVWDINFSTNGRWLATKASYSSPIQVWEVATGREAWLRRAERATLEAFSPDGEWLVTESWDDNTIRIWQTATGRQTAQIELDDRLNTVIFSPNSKWLVTEGWDDNTLRVWETATGHEVSQLAHDNDVRTLLFSPNSQWLATSTEDYTARVWEVATGQEVARLVHKKEITDIDFSPDSRYLATGSWDDTVRVLEVASGQEVVRVAHENDVSDVAFSPDGEWLATAGWDRTARVWLLWPEDLITEACGRLTRNLTHAEWEQYLRDEPYRPTCPNLPVPEE